MAAQGYGIQIISNLIQGVSQQAAPSRRDAQCDEQFDCVNSALEGAAARPHADLVKLFTGKNWDNALFSETSHGNNENYLTGVDGAGVPFAIDLADGTECTVTNLAPNYSYLTAGSEVPHEKLRAQVVDDTTFISNRSVVAAMSSTVSPAKVNEALLFIRASNLKTRYRVTLSGPGSADIRVQTSDEVTVNTPDIARHIATGDGSTDITILAGAPLDGSDGYSVTRAGSILRIRHSSGDPFTIATEDGNGDDFMYAFNGEAPSFGKLPAKGFTNMILKVSGERNTEKDDFYVKFLGQPSTGRWQETVGPNVNTTINAATMPHTLVCTAFRTFEFRRPAWSTRIAGDEDSAKDPGFIGKYIRDMTYHQNRLGILYDAGVDFSKTNFPYTFFPDTVQTVLATAPVSFKVSSGDKRGASVLDFATQAQESLYLWAQRVQFRVSSGGEAFKQDTVENVAAMSYQYSPDVYPLPTQSFLFLLTDTGLFASIRALQFNQTKLSGDVDLTSHVGQYISAGARGLISHDTLRYIMTISDDEPGVINLLNYTYDASQGFIQTGVNKWRIPGGRILWMGFKDNILRLLQSRPEGHALLSMDLTPQRVDADPGAKYLTRLDYRLPDSRVTVVAGAEQSTITLPYTPDHVAAPVKVVSSRDKVGGFTRGREFPVLSVVGNVVTVKGDLTDVQFYVGQRIRSTRRESPFYVRSDKGAIPTNFLNINRFFLITAQTGYTRIEVSTPNKATKSYEFPLRVLGSTTAITGTPVPRNGQLDVSIGERAEEATIELINDSFLPSYWQSAAYEYSAVGWQGAK